MSDRLRIVLLTSLALVAFAANSVLCRLALGRAAIDAASFSTVRLVSGAVALLLIAHMLRGDGSAERRGTPGPGRSSGSA